MVALATAGCRWHAWGVQDLSLVAALVLAGAAVTAGVDWLAVNFNRQRIEEIAKPLTMVWLIALVFVIDVEPAGARLWFFLGLLCGLVGDVLLLPRMGKVMPALIAFLAGHAAYIVGLASVGIEDRPFVIGMAAAALGVIVLGLPIVSAVKGTPLQMPVNAYLAVVATMAAMAYATQRPALWIGAVLFVLSDVLLGRDRFVSPKPDQRVFVHMLYHVGQLLLVLGLSVAST